MNTNASNEKAASDESVATNGQDDDQKEFAFKYHPIEDVENLKNYQVGGYHPIAIGDTLKDGRYQIVDKLGHGGYSTIWIARDRDAATQYVSVKICISDKTITSHENEIVHRLLDSDDKRASMILPTLDEFVLDGPNGQHPCIVSPPARMSIAASKSSTHGHNIFPLPSARAIAAQLAQAVAFCHAQGVVHGDLHTGNVLLRFAPEDNIHALSQPAFCERFGEPYQEPVTRIDGGGIGDGVPTHGVAPAFLGCRPQEVTLAESAILLTDFGESYMPSAPGPQRTYCHAPLRVTPPEAHFATGELGFPADIWALACVIWEVVGGSGSLFGSGFFPSNDTLRQDWVHVLGRLPDEWWDAWDGEFRRDLFTEDGAVRDDRPNYFISCGAGLEGRFELLVQEPRREEEMQEFLDEEKAALLEMLRGMLAYKPADRMDAQDVLCTEWMLRWGLPALAELKKSR
ncbi:hypothetical protein SLS64_005900 [Diaporthe eres]|uniref:non-specific serine/threonine protein kinase n=1 Tax=Diaporthe eres TaxID=83184 RepID=A0ABR1NSW8_DIAER